MQLELPWLSDLDGCMHIYPQELPIVSKLDPAIYGPPESAITTQLIAKELNGISVEEVNRVRLTISDSTVKLDEILSPVLWLSVFCIYI